MSSHNEQYEGYFSEFLREDPGDAGNISHGNRLYSFFPLKTAGAETRTLKTPLKAGTTVVLSMDTDGGNCVVTSEVAINQSGNTIMTFADAKDTITLVSIQAGGSYYWSVQGNDGVALS